MRRRHDPFLKLVYRVGARDAVTLFFPDLAARIDWAHLRWVEKEIPIWDPSPPSGATARKQRARSRSVIADLVGVTRDVEGRYLEVFLHPEIQREPDPAMDWRVLQYNAGLLMQEGNPEAEVLTVVFYHCRGGGEVRRREYRREFYGYTTLAVGYWVVGLGELEAEPYLEIENPMGWALAAWMQHPRRGQAEQRLRLQERILRYETEDEYYRRMLLDAVQTYYRLGAAEQEEEQRLLQTERYREVPEMLNTVWGRREAAVERRARAEALHSTLIQVLESRFTSVSADSINRIQSLHDPEVLQSLIVRAATAETLEEIEALLP